MLLPIRIVVPDAEGLRKILALERGKELIHAVFLRQIPEVPKSHRNRQNDHGSGNQYVFALARLGRVKRWCIKQSHARTLLVPCAKFTLIPSRPATASGSTKSVPVRPSARAPGRSIAK